MNMCNHDQAISIVESTSADIRPEFPKRAIVTAGMPYGNKELHLGHIGGVFVHADAFARFMRDRIGAENVIFVSGTDCYGSPILEHYRQIAANGEFDGTIDEFVEFNHLRQKEVLESYHISLDLFAASSIGRPAEIHREVSANIINSLYANSYLAKMSTLQFYDRELGIYLNGRQVVGQCPIQGCASDKGYADECSLGHQYMPADLINPKSTLSGDRPVMREASNWYFRLGDFHEPLTQWLKYIELLPCYRDFVGKTIQEFLEPPTIYLKRDQLDNLRMISDKLPEYTIRDEEGKSSVVMVFGNLANRERACSLLAEHSIHFRTGKTLVPFRITGNTEWGVPAPSLEGSADLTIWVWPESLWAPISFTMAYLEQLGVDKESWTDWWCSREAKIYQFIGEDNVYFYGPAEMSMFMGTQGREPSIHPSERQLQLPEIIANKHILFLNRKASSSGTIKAPTAKDLLNHYTADQLRAHFLSLGLGIKSVGFSPKPLNPNAAERDSDPVLKEGNLLSNAFNRAIRSCFYTTQKFYDGRIPVGDVNGEILRNSRQVILQIERLMYSCKLHSVLQLMDRYIQDINKYWASHIREAEEFNDSNLRSQTLVDAFHMVRVASVLMHPIAPEGTEMVLEYLNLGKEFWNWERIFEPIYSFMVNPQEHNLKFLEPRVDFFKKHVAQVNQFTKKREIN